MVTVHRMTEGHQVGYVKGAVEEVLARCHDELGSDGSLVPFDRDVVDRLHRR